MRQSIYDIEEVSRLIESGNTLLLSGDEKTLKNLPKGKWIAGTIPYFMSESGGVFDRERIFVTQLPEYVKVKSIGLKDKEALKSIYSDISENGAAFVIIPALSPTHLSFALDGPSYEGFATRPLAGWIAGVFLEELDTETPKVLCGTDSALHQDGAAVMTVELPDTMYLDMNIVNIFKQGDGQEITFPEDGFSAKEAYVDGKTVNFAQYVSQNRLDTRLPLVADYHGAMINTSFQSIDDTDGTVSFYAPVYKGVKYRHAAPVGNYVEEFSAHIPSDIENESIVFSCNCILNYLYGELNGKKTGSIMGPMTFGEIAYQLLNQTMVYLTAHKR